MVSFIYLITKRWCAYKMRVALKFWPLPTNSGSTGSQGARAAPGGHPVSTRPVLTRGLRCQPPEFPLSPNSFSNGAAQIQDADMTRFYLQNVPAHRTWIQLYMQRA
jgi:hypothetical protein